MIREGSALSEDLGPGFGRGMGMTTREKQTSHAVGQAPNGSGFQEMARKRVPGYPQDMFMVMDDAVVKPETYGLAPGWTGSMMGMMTVVRVLEPEMYEKVMAMIREGRVEKGATHPCTTRADEKLRQIS